MMQVHYSPTGGCEAEVVKELNSAKSTIQIAMYVLDNPAIVAAILAADARNVEVTGVFDKKDAQLSYSKVAELCVASSKINVYLDAKHAIFHDKYCIIDSKTLLTGSFNWTSAAEKDNAENLITITREPATIKSYQENIDLHIGHSVKEWPNKTGKVFEHSFASIEPRRY